MHFIGQQIEETQNSHTIVILNAILFIGAIKPQINDNDNHTSNRNI